MNIFSLDNVVSRVTNNRGKICFNIGISGVTGGCPETGAPGKNDHNIFAVHWANCLSLPNRWPRKAGMTEIWNPFLVDMDGEKFL
jgi:hypothetical protein